MPGTVSLYAQPNAGGSGMYCTITIKPHGSSAVLATITSTSTTVSSSVYLPIGTFDFTITIYNGNYTNHISCNTGYEFKYFKYDALNRVTEEGEYNSSSVNADFNQTNANNPAFPNTSTLVWKQYFYDQPSTAAMAAGQRNLHGRLSYVEAYKFGNASTIYYYSYNETGRIEWIVLSNLGWYQKKLSYSYDMQGNVTKKDFYDYDWRNGDFNTTYSYDNLNRMSKASTQYANGTTVQEGLYKYYANGKVQRLQLGGAQGVDYTYNTRDWLQMINHQNLGNIYNGQPQDPGRDGFDSGLPADKFGEVIGYDISGHIGAAQGAKQEYNGNISWQMYQMSGVLFNGYGVIGDSYAYDNANRLDSANFGYYTNAWLPTSAYDANYSYDNAGNFTALQRNGNTGRNQDNLSYNYTTGTNRLSSISGSTSAAYTYDSNGNVISDSHRGISFIINSPDNMPLSVYMTNGQIEYYENDVYGRRTSVSDASGNYNSYYYGADGKTEAICLLPYSSNLTYNILGAGGDNIGQVKIANYSVTGRYYYLKDHLGSIRMTVDVNGNIVGYDDYYPYGMQMTGRSYTSSADQRYKFTEKELDAPDGLYYFGKRYYDPFRGQWLQVDPMVSKYPGTSPYDYVLSNPIRLVDPDGSVTYMIDGVEVDQEIGQQLAEEYQQSQQLQQNNNQNDNGDNAHQVTTKDIVNREEEYFKSKLTGLSDLVSKTKTSINSFFEDAYTTVYGFGPEYLNTTSDYITLGGIVVGGISLSTGQAEFGLPIIGGSFQLSTNLDIAATVLTFIDYAVNGGTKLEYRASNQLQRLLMGGGFGETIKAITNIIPTYYPIYSPIIF